ncbi:hypothetical protein [uncultured Sphingomonas sp.]|uniref:hypothetical protein n=1 Tax=uncultured Sphingomonas sp. TaxID=158754 RepID=UPI002608E11E|nr:hypothetical protein [uncultured Sphingomonas sp.]
MSKTNPFAGLMAGFRGARAEDDKNDDEGARASRRAEEDKNREEEDARRAEEDQRRNDEDARRAEEDTPPNDDGTTDPKPALDKVDDAQDPEDDADDDNDVDAEKDLDDKGKKAFRAGLALGRSRESARGERIFLAAAKVGRPDLAATLAFTTRNSSAESDRLMAAAGAAPPSRGRSLDDRMANRNDPRPGADGGRQGKPSFADRVAAAKKKAGIS